MSTTSTTIRRSTRTRRPRQRSPPDPHYVRRETLTTTLRDLVRKILLKKEDLETAKREVRGLSAIVSNTNRLAELTRADKDSLQRQYSKNIEKQREIINEITILQRDFDTKYAELDDIIRQERLRNTGGGKKRKLAYSRKKGKKRYS
jgi:predicted RNase H-like nuclease (RuvC/YqgF family)